MARESKDARIDEAHAELVSHIERGSRRMRTLSAATVVIAAVLGVLYLYQLLLPALGTTSVTVDLTSPANVALELLLLLLALAWLYIGVADYRFASRISSSIKDARERESEIERKISG